MNSIKYYVFVLFVASSLLLNACQIKKKVVDSKPGRESIDRSKPDKEVRDQFLATLPLSKPFQCTGTIEMEAKGQTLSSSLRLSVYPSEGFMLSIRPIPLMEVARIYCFPTGVLFVNKIEKTYVESSYQALSENLNVDLSYDLIERLLFGYMLPYEQLLDAPLNTTFSFTAKRTPFIFTYLLDPDIFRPMRLFISPEQSPDNLLKMTYERYTETTLGGYPQEISLRYDPPTPRASHQYSEPFSMQLSLTPKESTPSVIREMIQRPSLSSYRRLSLYDLFSLLGSFSFVD